jgi:hypothetical protein
MLIMFYIFESQQRRIRDQRELLDASMRYGDQAAAVLRARAADRTLDERNRKHWLRLARKMRRFERIEAAENSHQIIANQH